MAARRGTSQDRRSSEQLADRLVESLGSVRRQLRRSAGRPWPAAPPLSGAQVELVRLVRQEPGATVSEAADALRLAPNTVSTLVGQLTDAGLLRREPDRADRRVARLHVTQVARQRLEQWRDHRIELTARALDGLVPADRDAIATAVPALARFACALQELEGAR
jgi:DNA-binding MarR family transcriptional regulator